MRKTFPSLFMAGILAIAISPVCLRAQGDVRVFRAVNRIIFAARPLKEGETWRGPTISVRTNENQAVLGFGAGCFISGDGLMLTANHVINNGSSYFVGFGKGIFLEVDVQARSEELDLALIKVKPPGRDLAWIRTPFVDSRELIEGPQVFMWGYLQVRNGWMQFLRSGIVSNNSDQDLNGDHMVYVETTAIDGTSGSPIFLRDGRPIGVVSKKLLAGGTRLPAGIIAIVPGEQINKFLKDAGVAGY